MSTQRICTPVTTLGLIGTQKYSPVTPQGQLYVNGDTPLSFMPANSINLVTVGAAAQTGITALVNGSSPQTFATSDLFKGNMVITPGVAMTLNFPTAAQLIAAMGNIDVGAAFDLVLRNESGANVITLGTGTNITKIGSSSVAISSTAVLRFIVQSKTSGAEAVTMLRLV